MLPRTWGIQYAEGFLIPSQPSLEYWIARSSRAMTVGNVARVSHRHCERKRSNPWDRVKKEWIASSLCSSQ
jgi:hypothetical protein